MGAQDICSRQNHAAVKLRLGAKTALMERQLCCNLAFSLKTSSLISLCLSFLICKMACFIGSMLKCLDIAWSRVDTDNGPCCWEVDRLLEQLGESLSLPSLAGLH